MNQTSLRVLTRIVSLTFLAGVCAGQRPPGIRPGAMDPDAFEHRVGRPLPRPDSPGEAIAFRQLQWRDENGRYAAMALLDAKAHVDRMRARARGLLSYPLDAAAPLSTGTVPSGGTTSSTTNGSGAF